MLTKTISPKATTNIAMSSLMVKAIFDELKLLRKELSFVLPQDDLSDYAHSEKISSSYKKAVKKYSPIAYGNY